MPFPIQDLDFQQHLAWSFFGVNDLKWEVVVSFYWYWWKHWPTLFELSFHSDFPRTAGVITTKTMYCLLFYILFLFLFFIFVLFCHWRSGNKDGLSLVVTRNILKLLILKYHMTKLNKTTIIILEWLLDYPDIKIIKCGIIHIKT